MSTPTATVLRPTRIAGAPWLAVIAVFVVGTATGAVATSMLSRSPADANVPAAVEPQPPHSELTRLLGNMDAAAERGDVRLFVGFREDLAKLIGSTSVTEYAALRGIADSSE
jgi:hypothetical protein